MLEKVKLFFHNQTFLRINFIKGDNMKELINKIKKNKLLTILLAVIIISCILGVLFPVFLKESNKDLIKTSIEEFFLAIDKNQLNYLNSFFQSLTNNIITTSMIWLLGISIIGIPIIIMSMFIKGFLVGFSFIGILITYGFKGLIIALIYTLPNIINLLSSFLLGYYAISFSGMIYRSVFKKETTNFSPIVKRYIKIGIFFLTFSVFISLIESYLVPQILKFL